MIIEDDELRDLFKIASEEHLQKLDDGLLHLEKYPDDEVRLEELLRETHSLKGDARMLGVRDVETLTHQLEHILEGVKRGETQLVSTICDRLYQGLDAIRKLVCEAVTGEPAGINTFLVLAQMMGAEFTTPANQNHQNFLDQEGVQEVVQPEDEEAIEKETLSPDITSELPETAADIETLQTTFRQTPAALIPMEVGLKEVGLKPAPNALDSRGGLPNFSSNGSQSPPSPPIALGEPYRIETIRVETRNLDALLTQAGELTVTKIRIAHRLAEIEEIVALWEESSRLSVQKTSALSLHREKITGGRQAVSFIASPQNGRGDRIPTAPMGGQPYSLNGGSQPLQHFDERLGVLINQLRDAIYEDTARLDTIAGDLEEGIRTLRLLPLSTIFQLFPRMVRDLARQQNKEVNLIIEGGETKADKRILEEMKDPLMHILRNCVDHGIETPAEREAQGKPRTATIEIKSYQTATNIAIAIKDDGRGLDIEKIKQTALKRGLCREEELAAMTPAQIHSLIFASGFSTRTFVTEVSGRGVGLDVVRTNVERLKGSIEVESTPGKGCTLRLCLGTTLATAPVLIVEVSGKAYALPVEFVQTTRLISLEQIFTIEGRETIVLNGHPVSVARLADLLELPVVSSNGQRTADKEQLPCIILKVGEEQLGIFVDGWVDQQDVVLKSQSKLLKRVRNVVGATILGTGEVCMILNPSDLIKSVRKRTPQVKSFKPITDEVRKPVILLTEDSIAIRTQEKRILEGAGYEVVTAVDGLDGFNKLKTRSFDAVVSDVQMPNLDGLGFAARIRQNKEYNEIPIILVTSLASDEDKRRGAEAGANAYITKGTFNQEILLETLRRLV
ncbi:hybrid sensor histidine kinase/response regulator [Coleofasciculus sp. FACHB-1120]|uniref:hybrid sensor histidine kinase/response regulator n=1 Tax=Coleofasciculus sp. FACHB-1120 TaxID=2692783 RepID=UPI0016875A8B|nr:hybrid sensor histidine kinase/response regulator [Coleofasciculus sp. FACHB-1120]MBD2740229.1 hybrid sensor histidine kinase/response regulator [Coleofasciculus sp. FACHB-1120]